jgi:CcmD family protein
MSQSPTSAPTGTASPDGRAQTFRPVEGGQELQSGERLLVEAYAAIWVILFVFLVLSWRRQRRIDERVATLEGALERARGAGGGPARGERG